ncbi:MAG TPA: hypothetical protein VND21_06885 [Planctomycetota bacterium]|nr:hypothetical protein [Planctomycetota bacterium]
MAEAETALAAVSEEPTDARDRVATLRKASGPRIAKTFDRLAALDRDDRAAVRAAAYLTGGYAWEPTKRRLARAEKALDDAAKGSPVTGALVLQRLRKLHPAGAPRYDRHEVELGTKDALLLGHPDHPLLAWVSLPRGWQKGKTYPVLVGVEGAGCDFAGYFRRCVGARGSRDAIVVTPCGLTNTNELKPETYSFYDPAVLAQWSGDRMGFDGPGTDKVLEIVRTRLGGEERVFVTGFSGGGNWCYWKLFMDPAHVRGAAPACANFSGMGISDPPAVGEDGGPPVLILTGANDPHRDHVFGTPPGIEGQSDRAQERLKELGYTKVRREQLKVGHAPLHAEVWTFVDEVRAAR